MLVDVRNRSFDRMGCWRIAIVGWELGSLSDLKECRSISIIDNEGWGS